MADLYGVTAAGTSVAIDANARKLVGDGASGVGPYASFGTPTLQAIKIISATINFATTYTTVNSNFAKAVAALQSMAEIYYVGIPASTGTGFVALVNLNKTDTNDGYGASSTFANSYENIEDTIRAALGTAEDDVTVTNVALTGLTFA